MNPSKSLPPDLVAEVAELRAQLAASQARLAESEETLEAIRTGAVDALVVGGPAGDRVFSLEGAETPYRSLVEEINEGALLLRPDGTILYANARFAQLADTPLEQVIGSPCHRFFLPAEHPRLQRFLETSRNNGHWEEFSLQAPPKAAPRPIEFSTFLLKGTQSVTLAAIVTDLTERKLAEKALRQANEELEARVQQRTTDLNQTIEALRESEQRFRAMANAMPQLAWIAQPDGFVNWYNQRWHEYTSTTLARVQGWGWQSVHDPAVLPTVLERWKASIASGQPFEMEFPLRGADGRFRQFLTRVVPFKDAAGRVLQWLGTSTDVDNLKHSEIELAALRDQLAAELTAMNRLHELATRFLRQEDPHTLFEAVLDDAIAILGANKGYFQLLEPASGQLRITAQRGFSPDFIEFFSRIQSGTVASSTALKTRHCVIVEDLTLSLLFLAEPHTLQFKLAQGVRAVVCAPLLTRAGAGLGVLSIHFATPHRPSERDLRLLELLAHQTADFIVRQQVQEEQSRLAAIVEGSEDAILSKSLDGAIRTWNGGAQKMFGYPAEEVIGRNVTLLVPPDRFDEEAQVLSDIARGEPVDHFETIRVAKDGRQIHVSLTISPLRDSQGRIVGASQIVRDITDLVRARQVLAQNKAELERLVEARTAKLQEALADLQHMSYSMVHDMRAPLRAMGGFITVLEERWASGLPPQGRDYFQRIRDGANRLDRLITDALNYNKVVRQDLPIRPIDLARLLRDMMDTYPNLQPGSADITLEFQDLVVLGNESLLAQCTSNLLDNALKFVAPGVKPHIRIWAQTPPPATINSRSSTHFVRLCITDNGIGIPKKDHEAIFAMFQRLHSQAEYPGTGIGLAIVRKAVERMGGRVGVDSEPGHGSTFWIDLPTPEAIR